MIGIQKMEFLKLNNMLPRPETLLSWMYVKYFEHKWKVCVMTFHNWEERYTVWDNTPWYTKEQFYNIY
jgi:hypothetical protein